MLLHAARALPFFCLFLCSHALRAQPAVSDVKVEAISHGTVAIRFQVSGVSGATESWIEYGPSHLLGYRTVISRTSTASPYRSLAVGGLRPDADYYFRPVVRTSDETVASWYCADPSPGRGYTCDGPDAPPRFRTAPPPGERPVPPALPETSAHPFPPIDGETFTVAVDDQRECLDFQAQLDAAAAADPSKNHQVVIPAGATCYGEFILPPKAGPGVVVIRPTTPLERLPPAGMRIDPSFKPLMATLSAPRSWRSASRLWHLPLSTPAAYECEAPCTQGWRLVGLEITHPSHTQIQPRDATIVSVAEHGAGQSLVTLDRPMPLEFLQSVAISGVSSAPKLNGVRTVRPVDETSFVVNVEPPAGGASGGRVVHAISIAVESCGPGPQPVCRTSRAHGLPAAAPLPIRSIESSNLETPEAAPWPWMTTVEVKGGPPGYDGYWGAYRSGNGLRLVGVGQDASCSSGCGEVALRPAVQAFGFEETAGLNGSRLYTVVSETEVRLDDVEDPTPPSAGGFLSLDPNSFPRLVLFGDNSNNLVLDRCWIHGRGFPTRLEGAIALLSDDSALVDSVVSDVHSWRPIAPRGGSADAGAHGYFAGAATVVTLGDASRVEIRNNLFENCIGITVYAEAFRRTARLTPSDIVIAGNAFRNQDRFRAGAAESDGRYYAIRHAVELKRGQKVLIEDNLFDGNWADWTPLGPAIGLLTRAGGSIPNNRIQDVTIRNNVFRRVSTGVQLASTDDLIEQPSFPAARIAIENNWFAGIDFYRMRSAPSGVALLLPSQNFGGQAIFAGGSFEDLTIRHNTTIDNRGRGPGFFWYQRGRSSGVAVTDNVLTHNDDSHLGGLPRAGHAFELGVNVSGPPSAGFAAVFTQTPDPDPTSSFARNLVLPGVRDSSSASSYDDASAESNFSKADCEAFYAGFPDIECAGSGQPGETANQRFAAAFADLANPRDPRGRGADIDQLDAVAAEIREAVWSFRDSAGTLRFRTAAAGPCLVDLSSGPDFAGFVRAEAAGGEQRAAVFEGLGGGSYYYRIKCASATTLGETGAP